ncbi:putative membrane protein [Cerasibacillus quisquiliarum]|uniref:YibE/F n=1 Tax=Cerasibacillus quisquiliarum TaxID=227865 RepID=A0A511UT85_9BACI|nr:YibE/F family protein [Cerasibacillus quisquiliarum]MBB5145303.1 putative membrane protein [Cerasibacillus quisquiliarum]GEN29805.1 hypothetical protein CQU01_00430 [Cerasibacillus quisquiliarum]
MNAIGLLSVILFTLMAFVGGRQGVRSFVALLLNLLAVILTVFFMLNTSINLLIITLIACVLISCINLFFINEINDKTIAAFLATIITVTILLLFIHLVTKYALIQGFSEEETDEISGYSLYIGIDFVKIVTSVIIMSTIGAIMDVAISISSSLHHLLRLNPLLNKKELFQSGLNIGRDILGTDANTIFFAFFGGYLGLLIWFKDLEYSFGEIVNSKVFSGEMMTIFCAGIGIALIIPISSWISTFILMRDKEKSTSNN